jgi:hypothetical protein
MEWNFLQMALWLIAGLVSFYFSLGTPRVWTSISLGFALILFGELIPQAIPFLPGTSIPQVEAMGYILGTIAILVMSHGFQEYHVFSRTLELSGNKWLVYLVTLVVIGASLVFILINPDPDRDTLELIRVVSLTNWVFLSLINIDLLRKIYLNVKGSPIARGMLAFMLVFFLIFLWKGSNLYIRVYNLDQLTQIYPFRYHLSVVVANVANILASLSVGGTFLYLVKLLR